VSVSESDYVTAEHIAKVLDLNRRTVYRWVNSGLLPSIKLGAGHSSAVRIKRSDLDEFLENARRNPTPVEPVRPRRRRRSRVSA
jgi:excisionase family DNA binding protein